MDAWAYSLGSVILVSLLSFIGLFTFPMKERTLEKVLLFLVSFSAGALFGDAFLHLLPEAVEAQGFSMSVSISLLGGIVVFFIFEKFIHWRHCHIPASEHHHHPVAFMNLIGDGVHNFIDGLVIGASYLASIPVGIATTLAVILHEIPQEIGDFGVLLHAGYSKKKALFFNFMSALASILGVAVVLAFGTKGADLSIYLVPFAAGGFIYIAGFDLIPELHKETNPAKSAVHLIAFIAGITVMILLFER
ncbi:MAG: ZIP family metal transporter [Nanoarchaeota archaeon]|nr:ZIP family metal transporter [Nanoarchaeota archaeon]MBU4299632.1 ZIP family metal transporter [Nanoarchaeota archaeon]MBU4452622.1 ZIP family metal transporter [Nanoarchaeota archaeon]MCG2723911.1 ZIP family metal transporter [archaeon]